jgi:hypothetical protein
VRPGLRASLSRPSPTADTPRLETVEHASRFKSGARNHLDLLLSTAALMS